MLSRGRWERLGQDPLPGHPRDALVAAVFAIGTVLSAQQPTVKPPVLVEGARVLDVVRGRYLAPAAVFIENGRIKSVTPEPPASLPSGTVRVKAAGSVLVPGLVDAHAWAAPASGLEADYFYLMGLAHGVTGFRVLNVRTGWGVAQRERSISGEILAPRLWTSGRGINQGASPDRWLFDATDPSVAIGEVRRQIDAKVNWVAGYESLPPDIYRAIVTAARRTGVRVSGQPGASSMSDLAAAGVGSIESLAYPLKPRSATAADAWPAVATRDLNALQTRLVRGRVTLVPMMAAADGARVSGGGRRGPGACPFARSAARRAESGAEEAAGGRRGKGETGLDEPGGVPETLRRRRRTRSGRHRIRTGRLSRAGRRPSP